MSYMTAMVQRQADDVFKWKFVSHFFPPDNFDHFIIGGASVRTTFGVSLDPLSILCKYPLPDQECEIEE